MIDESLLDLLRCPFHPESPKLILRGEILVCPVDGKGFRILDGIPDMLPEDAVSADEVKRLIGEIS